MCFFFLKIEYYHILLIIYQVATGVV